ncbi:hypothetical protein, partial [Klebsiella pneumoniae]|uniref:hypothetical protein n=1 Tax=Klebsiella pneumoniae TaxID=573 RepID=UPI00300ACBA1
LMVVEGELQRSREGVIHVMAQRIIDRSEVLGALSDLHVAEPPLAPADEFLHPRAPRGPLPPSPRRHPRDAR